MAKYQIDLDFEERIEAVAGVKRDEEGFKVALTKLVYKAVADIELLKYTIDQNRSHEAGVKQLADAAQARIREKQLELDNEFGLGG